MDPHATAAASRHESPRTAPTADALLALKGLERVVVSLYYVEGLRLPEIALVLDLGEVEVARLYARALASLRAAEPVAHRQAA